MSPEQFRTHIRRHRTAAPVVEELLSQVVPRTDRLGGRRQGVQRDVAAAVKLYETVYHLGHSTDQQLRVVKTMMAAANS